MNAEAVQRELRDLASVEQNMDEPVPPFDPKGCRYDQKTYEGRLKRFKELTDPRLLLIGDDELAKVIFHASCFLFFFSSQTTSLIV